MSLENIDSALELVRNIQFVGIKEQDDQIGALMTIKNLVSSDLHKIQRTVVT